MFDLGETTNVTKIDIQKTREHVPAQRTWTVSRSLRPEQESSSGEPKDIQLRPASSLSIGPKRFTDQGERFTTKLLHDFSNVLKLTVVS